jgi:DNA polymerase-3 subunit epsilon
MSFIRQIVLDTETTGLDPHKGHRIIEVGCIELINRRITGKSFHHYLNPQRDIEQEAQAIHGITEDFLKDKPLFSHIVTDFLRFIEGAELIIHNAPFDLGFLHKEMSTLKLGKLTPHHTVIDTLVLAKTLHPGQKNNLDALCRRYGINNSHREWHGALLDAELLALAYLSMTAGQGSLFEEAEEKVTTEAAPMEVSGEFTVILPSEAEQAAHKAYLAEMQKSGQCLWG